MVVVGRKKEVEWHCIQKGDGKMSNIIFPSSHGADSFHVFISDSLWDIYGIFNCEVARASLVAV